MNLISVQLVALAAVAAAYNPDAIRAFDDFLVKAIEEGDVPDIHSIPTIPPPPSHNNPRVVSSTRPHASNPWDNSGSAEDDATEQALEAIGRTSQDDSNVLGTFLQQRYTQLGQRQSRRRLSKRRIDPRQAFELRESYQDARIPHDEWDCCVLGNLAGDKGFLCVSNFYASRLSRNVNRVHNRRLDFTSPNTWAILQSFQRCVLNDADAIAWQNCCEQSLQETQNRHQRWQQFRTAVRPRDEL